MHVMANSHRFGFDRIDHDWLPGRQFLALPVPLITGNSHIWRGTFPSITIVTYYSQPLAFSYESR